MALERFANTPTPAAPSTPWTTLNGAITSGALSLTVTSASAFPSSAQFRVLIDSEWILITAGAGTSTWTVTRGVDGSTPTAHAHGASIFHVLTAAALLRNPRSMTTLGDMEYMAADLGPARLAAPSDGDYVTRWTSGVPSWIASGGGGGTPGGSSGQLQYNNAGAFGGTDRLTWSSPVLSVDRAWAEFEFLADPTTAPTATAVLIAGNIEVGQHAYVVIFFDAAGNQTTTSPESNAVTMDGTHKQVDLTSIPIGPSGTVGRYIMRRYLAVDPSYWWVATINDNVTTTLRDNVAYGSSGANPPFYMGPIGTVPFNYTGGGLRDGNGGSVVQVAPQGVLLPGTWYAKMSYPQQGPIIYSHDAAYGAPEAFLHYTQQNPPIIGPSFFLGVGCGNLTNTGDANFGVGYQALRSLTTGDSNTAFGLSALANCTSGFENVAVGQSALVSVTTGFENVAIGASAGANLTTGSKNVFIGKETNGPTTGNKWVILGEDAGGEGTSGDCNICIGVFAGTDNAGTGTWGPRAGSNNTFIGEHTGFSTNGDFSNTLVIGHQALVDASNKAVIGNASVTDVYFGALAAAAKVHAAGYYSADGTLGVTAGPFTTITGITVKNGLVVSLTGS